MADQRSPRRRFQFRLRTLMLIVAFASVFLAAMRFATDLWTSAAVTVAISSLLFSIALAVYRRGFWIGFAICCGGYLLLFMLPFSKSLFERQLTFQVESSLFKQMHPESDYFFTSSLVPPKLPSGKIGFGGDYEHKRVNFQLIVHSLWALIFGALGGWLSRFATVRSGG